MVRGDTDVCIEGYPRSGNSFLYRVFQRWNPESKIAHHLHVPMQVRRAIVLGVPSAVLIREPADAVSSLAVFFGGDVSDDALLKTYVSFYETLMPLRDQIAICPFEAMVADPRLLPIRLNERFGTSFAIGDWGPTAEAAVREQVTTYHRTERSGLESRLPLPNAEKDAVKQSVKPRVEEHARFEDAVAVRARFLADETPEAADGA
jgi:hypothetical protein